MEKVKTTKNTFRASDIEIGNADVMSTLSKKSTKAQSIAA